MAQVDPSFLVQKQVRENTQDLQSFMLDLKNWEDGMKKKEQNTFGSGMEDNTTITRKDVKYVKEVFEEGCRRMKTGKWELAAESFSKAIKVYKKNPVFFLKRAKCYLKLKKHKEAEADCTKALSLDPKLLKAKYYRSQAREMIGNYRGACLDLQDIIILDPANQTAQAALNNLKPQYQKALRRDYKHIFNEEEQEEGEGEVQDESKSLILGTLGANERAAEEAALEEKVQKANQCKEKGNKLVKEEKWQDAKEAYSKAIILNPEDPIFYANRAFCHLKLNDEHRAVLDCSMALKKNPKYVKAYMRRAVARKGTGDLWGARSDVKQTLLLEPHNTQAKSFLEELNVLIEQKVYRDFDLHAENDNESEEEFEDCEEYMTCEENLKPETEKMEVDHNQDISKSNESNKENPQATFKYVFPIDKPEHKISKKPLRRIPIKFIDNEPEGKISLVKKNEENVPEWLNFPLSEKQEKQKGNNFHDSIKKSRPDIAEQAGEKKELTASREDSPIRSKNGAENMNAKDFKYVFPITKKPHQRSKKPLQRIPIKFTM